LRSYDFFLSTANDDTETQYDVLISGLASVLTSLYLCLYYNIINAWSFWYLFNSFQVSPYLFYQSICNSWPQCTYIWKSETRQQQYQRTTVNRRLTSCVVSVARQPVLPWAECPFNITAMGPEEECRKTTPTEYFFYRQTLNISSSIEETGGIHLGQALCLLLAWIFTYLFILRGVKSTGKVRVRHVVAISVIRIITI